MPKIITIPSNMVAVTQVISAARFDLGFMGGQQGDAEIQVYGPPRWKATYTQNDAQEARQHGAWTSVLLKLEGKLNRLAVYDFAQPEPLGDYRPVSPVMVATAQKGDNVLRFWDGSTALAGKTLFAGTWIGVNQAGTDRQVVKVVDDAVAGPDGQITVNVMPYLRKTIGAGSSIELYKPTWLGMLTSDAPGWNASGVIQGGMSLEFTEVWLS